MAYRKDVGRYVSLYGDIKREDFAVWLKARRARSIQSAHRILTRAFPNKVIAEPFVRSSDQHKFLSATGQYTQNGSNPEHFDDREPIATGAVERFSPGAHRPKTRRRPRRNGPTIGLPSRDFVGLAFNATPTKDLEG